MANIKMLVYISISNFCIDIYTILSKTKYKFKKLNFPKISKIKGNPL
jgi:hypothetical protein